MCMCVRMCVCMCVLACVGTLSNECMHVCLGMCIQMALCMHDYMRRCAYGHVCMSLLSQYPCHLDMFVDQGSFRIVIELAQVVQSQNTDMNIGGIDHPLNDVAFLTSRSQSIQNISFKTKTEH